MRLRDPIVLVVVEATRVRVPEAVGDDDGVDLDTEVLWPLSIVVDELVIEVVRELLHVIGNFI